MQVYQNLILCSRKKLGNEELHESRVYSLYYYHEYSYFYEHTNRIDGRRHLLTLNMKHPVWNLLMLHKVRTRRFLKIGAVCAFQFVITRIARFLRLLFLIPYLTESILFPICQE